MIYNGHKILFIIIRKLPYYKLHSNIKFMYFKIMIFECSYVFECLKIDILLFHPLNDTMSPSYLKGIQDLTTCF